MTAKQLVVESFDRDNVSHPHEDGHCKTTKAVPVAYMECQCGFSGLAHVVNGSPVCPAHLARVEQHKRETNQTLETAAVSPNIQSLIDAAVAKALSKGGN
jgi:hypothetical protein